MSVKEGDYKAKISGYGIRETQKGLPEPVIRFTLEDEGKPTSLNWRGSLNEGKAREITIKALLVCGLKTSDLSALADGPSSGALDMNKEVMIRVSPEVGMDGKTYMTVKWVNELGGAAFKAAITRDDAVKKMAGMNIDADVMLIAQDNGYEVGGSVAAKPAEAPLEEIPF